MRAQRSRGAYITNLAGLSVNGHRYQGKGNELISLMARTMCRCSIRGIDSG